MRTPDERNISLCDNPLVAYTIYDRPFFAEETVEYVLPKRRAKRRDVPVFGYIHIMGAIDFHQERSLRICVVLRYNKYLTLEHYADHPIGNGDGFSNSPSYDGGD